jgi:DNA (cytosine-5)-methyltransferase 1
MKDDPRNGLYLHYLKFLKELKPEIFVFENVPGISSAKSGKIVSDFIEKADKLNYHVEHNILNALNFNVLQNRKRVIFIGWKKEYDLTYPDFGDSLPEYKIWNLLNDLPPLEPGMGTNEPVTYNQRKASKYLKISGIRTDEKRIRNHIARMHNERDRAIYKIAIEKWNQEEKRLKYNDLKNDLKTHKNQSSFLDRYKVVDGNGYSHAIVSHLSKDGHHFIHPDINQARSLTVREAARIQSFPDNYIFEGPRTSQYVQVGNAVPPLMAKGIAEKINEMLQEI